MTRLSASFAALLLLTACSTSPQGPSTTPAASTAPEATPAESVAGSAGPRSFGDADPGGQLAPGEYVLHYDSIGGAQAFPTLAITFTVPGGWERVIVDGVVWGNGARLGFAVVDNLYADPCDPDLGLLDPAVGPSVGDLTRALVNVPGWQASEVSFDSFFGFPGDHLELTAPADGCTAEGEPRLLHTLGYPGYVPALEGNERLEIWNLNVQGTRLVIVAHRAPEASAALVAELEAIIDSIQIRP